MPLLIYPATPPPIHPSGYSDDEPVIVVPFVGTTFEQRVNRLGRKLRSYHLQYRTTNTRRLILQAFFESVRGPGTSFLFKDLDDYRVTGVSLGVSVAAQTVFALPTTGARAGDYPVSAALSVLYDDGGSVSIASVQTDARTITASSVPSVGSVMTADYDYYRRVRLREMPSWTHAPYGVWSASVELLEVGQS